MPTIIRVIPARHWLHAETGQTASVYGAAPWVEDADRQHWTVVSNGWTWERTSHTGSVTVGLGRRPAETAGEAIAVARQIAERTGAEVRVTPVAAAAELHDAIAAAIALKSTRTV